MIASTVVGLELGPKKPEEKEKSPYLNKEYKHPKGEISFPAESTPAVTNVTCRLCVQLSLRHLTRNKINFLSIVSHFLHCQWHSFIISLTDSSTRRDSSHGSYAVLIEKAVLVWSGWSVQLSNVHLWYVASFFSYVFINNIIYSHFRTVVYRILVAAHSIMIAR